MTDIYSYKYAFQWDVYRLLQWPLGRGGLCPLSQRHAFTENPSHRSPFIETSFHRDLLHRDHPPPRNRPPDTDPPGQRQPWPEPPMDRAPWTETPQKEHGTGRRDPREGTWDKAARQEVTSYRDPLARMTGTRL